MSVPLVTRENDEGPLPPFVVVDCRRPPEPPARSGRRRPAVLGKVVKGGGSVKAKEGREKHGTVGKNNPKH